MKHGTPEEAGVDPERVARLKTAVPTWLDPQRFRSGVLLAARKGVVFYHEALGPLGPREDSPPTVLDTIFPVASITKPITAILAMTLVEEGRLALNRPLQAYLPELCGKGAEEVQVQHLFAHTSGYLEEEVEAVYEVALKQSIKEGQSIDEIWGLDHNTYFNALWDLPVRGTPGAEMSYADYNFDLLGEVVRRVAGMPLEDFAKQALFDPLGLKDISYGRTKGTEDRCIERMEYSEEIKKRFYVPWGANNLHTSAYDLACVGQLLLDHGRGPNGPLLSPASVREMTRNQIPGIGTELMGWHKEASWSLGWAIQHDERWRWYNSTLAPKGVICHIGAGGHCIWIDPMNEIVGVHLSVSFDIDPETGNNHFNLDKFQNMVTACAR